MTWVKRILFVLLVIYIGVCFAACAFQDQFAFYPDDRPARLDDESIAKNVAIETPDGERLVAFYAAARPKCPTFVNFHGNAQHLSGLGPITEYYGRHGIGFLAVAFRGYSGSTGKPTERGVRIDGLAAYDYLRAQGLQPEEIVIRGFSLGSSVAIGVAGERDAKAVILGAPFESGTRLGGEMLRVLPVGLLARNSFRSDRLAQNVTEPVLIIHGRNDRIIPEAHSIDLLEHFPTRPTRIGIADRDHNDLQDGVYEGLVAGFLSPLFPDCPSLQELAK